MYGNGFPRLSVDWEKSPARSRAVGSRNVCCAPPPVAGLNSSARKKKSLLLPPGFPTGPPMENPKSCAFDTVFGTPFCLLASLLEFQSELRRTLYTEPRNRFVPLLVTAITCRPLRRPYSA